MMTAVQPPGEETMVLTAPESAGCASHAKRWVLIATILGSGIASLEASVVNIALPAIQDALSVSVSVLQGIATAYTLALAALTLAAGAAGDRFGKRRLFLWGAAGLAVASLACGLATSGAQLLVGRGLQGLAAALLVPNSLGLLSTAFPKAERGRAIGIWSGATALLGAVGPILGGWLVDIVSWRAAFLLVVPLALVTVLVAARRVPDPPILRRAPAVDWVGAALSIVGVAGLISAIILSTLYGLEASVLLVIGALSLAFFFRHEARTQNPMMPIPLLRSRAFLGLNLLTLLLYFAVAATFFLLPFNLIQVQHYSASSAGAAFLPFALVVGVLSRWAGRLGDRWGIRSVLILGAFTTATGLALFALPWVGGSYWSTFFVPVAMVGLGMALCGTPLTTLLLRTADASQASLVSGVNNAFARFAALLAVAVIGVVMLALFSRTLGARRELAAYSPSLRHALTAERRGLADMTIPDSVQGPERIRLERMVAESFVSSFRTAALLCAGSALAAGLLAALTVRKTADEEDEDAAAPGCAHTSLLLDAVPISRVCEACVRLGDRWVHLRVCLSCGHVGCCDSSKNRHATAHFWATKHPVVRSLEPGESWRWCYVDEIVV